MPLFMGNPAKRLRHWLREKFPQTYGRVRKLGYPIRRINIIERNFGRKYRTNGWASPESRSGPGSTLANTRIVRQALPEIIKEFSVRRMLDIPCGDFNWMKSLALDLDEYIGADVVSEIIAANQRLYSSESRRFVRLDLTHDALPQVDLILCRDCLVHLDFHHIQNAFRQIKASGSTYLLATTYSDCATNADIMTGEWRRLNLTRPPFNLPPPLKLINEQCTDTGEADKCLGLWRVKEIPGC